MKFSQASRRTNKSTLSITAIVIFAAFLRLYQLGQNPPSLDWDEASMGYNAYSLLATGRDEYGNSWPVSIRSFNDYKPPLYTYITIPSVAIFGLTEFAVRFPSALAGTLTVLLTYFLVKELFPDNKWKMADGKWNISLPALAAVLLAVSPWHLQFSRVAFEANLALFFFVLAVVLFTKAVRMMNENMRWKMENGKWKIQTTASLLASSASFVFSMYSYHSARLVVPLFILLMLALLRRVFVKQKEAVVLSGALAAFLLIPMGVSLARGSAQTRFQTVSFFTNPGIYTKEEGRFTRQAEFRSEDQGAQSLLSAFHHPWIVFVKTFAEGYMSHFNLDFLFLRGDGIGRHTAVGMGLVYIWEFPFLIAGSYALIKNRERANRIIFPWLAVAPVASALTTQTPHAVRSLLMLPTLTIITAYGLFQITRMMRKHWYVLVLIGLLILLNVVYYLDLYYIHTPIERSHEWQYGYKQLVGKLNEPGTDAHKVIMTTRYDQPYIYVLFFERVDPSWYQTVAETGSQGFGRYEFRKIEFGKEALRKNVIVAGTPDEIPDGTEIFDTIQFLSGTEAFRLVKL